MADSGRRPKGTFCGKLRYTFGKGRKLVGTNYDPRYWDSAASFYTELGLPWQWLKDGYVPVVVEMKKALGGLRGKRILDHGCGAGKIARLLKSVYGVEVCGIDPSENMICEARKADPHGRYDLLAGDFPWPDSSLDGVMSNWVFVNIGTVEEMDTAAREIHRVLRPGGPFVMLVNNQEWVGRRASTYQNGKLGQTYCPGDEIVVTYFKSEDECIEFKDYYWPTETYCSVAKRAGFKEVFSYVPELNPHTIGEIKLLQGVGVFPRVDCEALAGETPTVVIVANK